MRTIFNQIGEVITSLGAVIFVMLMVISAMIFFSHTLFINAFPNTMATWEKHTAAWFMALGWEFTVLITTVNTKHLNSNIPRLMALSSGIILLFFLQAFDFYVPILILCQRWFVAMLVASLNFIYSELFYAKWKERIEAESTPLKLNQAHSRVDELEQDLNEARSKLLNVSELEKFKTQTIKELTCPHCKVEQSSFGSLHAHKGHCLKNPKRKLNGKINEAIEK